MENLLWYKRPAQNWNEALPLGNGQIGAMVFGGVETAQYGLNHDTLWSGYPKDNHNNNLKPYYDKSVELAMNKKYIQAQDIIEKNLCTEFTEGYMPLGDLNLHLSVDGKVNNYVRKLNLDTACCEVQYQANNITFMRKTFISKPHNCMVIKLAVNKAGALSFDTELLSQLRYGIEFIDNKLILVGRCPSHVDPNYVESDNPIIYDENNPGISFVCGLLIRTDGDKVFENKIVKVKNATFAEVILSVESNYIDFKTAPINSKKNYKEQCLDRLSLLEHITYDELYDVHVNDYSELEKRCHLNLGGYDSVNNIPTDERLKLFESNKDEDLGLYELLFRYGRYLLISSSRDKTQPANLQGIWNDKIRAPWASNYTLNINTEMNYWPVFMTDLTECANPLIKLVEELSETGRYTAKNIYGAEGFVCHHNTDLWRASNPVGAYQKDCACYGFWSLGAAWLCRTVFEYYEYTQDKKYLKNIAFPILKEASEFLINILKRNDDGNLILCPTTSPENNFSWEEGIVSISKSSAMSQGIVYDLLNNTLKACDLVEELEFKGIIENVIKSLKLFDIGEDGRLLEWNDEVEEVELHHRHVSHLYGLHPAQLITPRYTPELAEACKKSLNVREDWGTGWSLAWKINLWARLNDGERAGSLLKQRLHYVNSTTLNNFDGGGTYPNMFCAHPPFQIDGNLGVVSGITEMLVQSYKDEITLLPALPEMWKQGNIQGVALRGNIKVNIFWKDNELILVELTSLIDRHCKIWYGNKSKEVCLEKDKKQIITLENFD